MNCAKYFSPSEPTESPKKPQLLWVDLNSSFVHASFALPALHAQAQILAYKSTEYTSHNWDWKVVSGTVAGAYAPMLKAAVNIQPQVIASTTWLFNHQSLLHIISRMKALVPQALVILGGPEFLGNNEAWLRAHPYVNVVFRGEGEEGFSQWLSVWQTPEQWGNISGLCWIDHKGIYHDQGRAKVQDFVALAAPETSCFFPVDKPFVQFETARGCFNRCAFCTSGGDTPVRTLPVSQLRPRLQYLISKGVKEIRLLDRTFNAQAKRASELLALFNEFAGQLRFHLEIHPALLSPELLQQLAGMPKGLLHLEAGIQSLDDRVLEASKREGNSAAALKGLRFLSTCTNFETHADLIAGLPLYTMEQMMADVKTLMGLGLAEIQLELLKLLPGTSMRARAAELGIIYAPLPPYEVLETPTISLEQLRQVQQLSRILDGWYNGNSDWRKPFADLMLQDPDFLYPFLQSLSRDELLSQPLSMERRGLLLYEFCLASYPSWAPEVSLAWILAGHSLKKTPGLAATAVNVADIPATALPFEPYSSNTELRFYRLPTPSGDYFFGFDREQVRKGPVWCALEH